MALAPRRLASHHDPCGRGQPGDARAPAAVMGGKPAEQLVALRRLRKLAARARSSSRSPMAAAENPPRPGASARALSSAAPARAQAASRLASAPAPCHSGSPCGRRPGGRTGRAPPLAGRRQLRRPPRGGGEGGPGVADRIATAAFWARRALRGASPAWQDRPPACPAPPTSQTRRRWRRRASARGRDELAAALASARPRIRSSSSQLPPRQQQFRWSGRGAPTRRAARPSRSSANRASAFSGQPPAQRSPPGDERLVRELVGARRRPSSASRTTSRRPRTSASSAAWASAIARPDQLVQAVARTRALAGDQPREQRSGCRPLRPAASGRRRRPRGGRAPRRHRPAPRAPRPGSRPQPVVAPLPQRSQGELQQRQAARPAHPPSRPARRPGPRARSARRCVPRDRRSPSPTPAGSRGPSTYSARSHQAAQRPQAAEPGQEVTADGGQQAQPGARHRQRRPGLGEQLGLGCCAIVISSSSWSTNTSSGPVRARRCCQLGRAGRAARPRQRVRPSPRSGASAAASASSGRRPGTRRGALASGWREPGRRPRGTATTCPPRSRRRPAGPALSAADRRWRAPRRDGRKTAAACSASKLGQPRIRVARGQHPAIVGHRGRQQLERVAQPLGRRDTARRARQRDTFRPRRPVAAERLPRSAAERHSGSARPSSNSNSMTPKPYTSAAGVGGSPRHSSGAM